MILRDVIAAHIAVDQSAAVQNSAELHCAPAPVHLVAPIRFLVQFYFAVTGLFVSCSQAWMLHHEAVSQA